MPKKGQSYTSAPKRLYFPADLGPLGQYAVMIKNSMRQSFAKRMEEPRKRKTEVKK